MCPAYRVRKAARNDMTNGNLLRAISRFSIPYLISCFLQSFYGMADLFIAGRFNAADTVTAVAVGSQVIHMLTVIIVGLAMGITVSVSRSVGAGDSRRAARYIGNSASIFAVFAALLTAVLLPSVSGIIGLLKAPPEAVAEAEQYLVISFLGIPFITAYNVISSVFRGLGDTKRPMIFVAVAGAVNVGLDCLFIGAFNMGAAGAALATVLSQAVSVLPALLLLKKIKLGVSLSRGDFKPAKSVVRGIIGIGAPISCQDGFIQISFLVITAIANSRGVTAAAAVGIVEKIIGFLFLVPSAMLSTVAAVAAQNAGAEKDDRAKAALHCGIGINIAFGAVACTLCLFLAPQAVEMFVNDEAEVVRFGAQYLRAYSLDCVFAGIHFCFSGYFSAYGKSMYSFAHNLISIIALRIPFAYFAAVLFPKTLFPMGLASPAGSLLSDVICLFLYRRFSVRRRTVLPESRSAEKAYTKSGTV